MPSGYVVVYGHGDFTPSASAPIFSVPDDTRVLFLTEALKTLYMDSEELMSEWTASDLDDNATQEVGPNSGCFNYAVGPDEDALPLEGKVQPPPGVEFDIIKSDERLQSIVNRHTGKTVVMATCRVVNLKEVGGEKMGVNTRGMEVDESDLIKSEALQQMEETRGEDFTPQGVTQCDETCPECNEQCRWNDEHVGNYDHRCEQDHEWS
jgi:hypothetical protein